MAKSKKSKTWLWVGAGALALIGLSSMSGEKVPQFGGGGGSPLFGGFMGGGDLDTTSKKDDGGAVASPIYNLPAPQQSTPALFDFFSSPDSGGYITPSDGKGGSYSGSSGGFPIFAIDTDTFSKATKGYVPSKKDNVFGVQTYDYNPSKAMDYGIAGLQAGYWNLGGVPTAGSPIKKSSSSGGSSSRSGIGGFFDFMNRQSQNVLSGSKKSSSSSSSGGSSTKSSSSSSSGGYSLVRKTSSGSGIYTMRNSKKSNNQGMSTAFPKKPVFTGLPVSQA